MKYTSSINYGIRSKSPKTVSKIIAFLTLLIIALIPLRHALAGMPSANSKISNQGWAEYRDDSGGCAATGGLCTVRSNIVTVTVSEVFELTLEATAKLPGKPSDTVYFPVTLTNTGNADSKFDITTESVSGDLETIEYVLADDSSGKPVLGAAGVSIKGASTQTPPVREGQRLRFIVAAKVKSVTSAKDLTFKLKAAPSADASKSKSTVLSVDVVSGPTFDVSYRPLPDNVLKGTSELEVTLVAANPAGSGAGFIYLDQPLGAGLVLNTTEARISGKSAKNGSSLELNGHKTSFSLEKTELKAAFWLAEGQVVELKFNLKAQSDAVPGSRQLKTQFGAAGDLAGGSDVPPLAFKAVSYDSPSLSVYVADRAAVHLETPAPVSSAVAGTTVDFPVKIKNTGPVPDTFKLTTEGSTFPDGTTFQFLDKNGNPLGSTTSDGTPDTGALKGTDGEKEIILRVSLPFSKAKADESHVNVVATSVVDAAKKGSTKATVGDIVAPAVELAVSASIDTLSTEDTIFPVTVKNTTSVGTVAQRYVLAAQVTGGPANVRLYQADKSGSCTTVDGLALLREFALAPGNSQIACAWVEKNETVETLTLSFNVNSSLGAHAAKSTLLTRTRNAIVVEPFYARAPARRFEKAVFSHKLSNRGNHDVDLKALRLVAENADGWDVEMFYADTDERVKATSLQSAGSKTMRPGESVYLWVEVLVPPRATHGSKTTIKDAANSVLAVDEATISLDGKVEVLLKSARTDCSETAQPDEGAFQPGNVGAAPGDCVWYEVRVKNLDPVAVDDLKIIGPIPPYTKSLPVGASPVSSADSAVTRAIDSLPVGGEERLFYRVQVDK